MSIFSTVSVLVNDYRTWQRYRPVVDDVEAVLKKHGIDVVAMFSGKQIGTPDPDTVKEVQEMLNNLGAHPPLLVDGIMGEATLAALLTELRPAS